MEEDLESIGELIIGDHLREGLEAVARPEVGGGSDGHVDRLLGRALGGPGHRTGGAESQDSALFKGDVLK